MAMVRSKVTLDGTDALTHSSPPDKDFLLTCYYKMLVARAISDRMLILNRQGRAPFAVTAQGHEACEVASAMALCAGKDWFLPYYRDIGVVLALGMTAREIMLHFLARAADPCSGGRQMPNHWSYPALRIVTGSSVVGTQLPHAAGIALASKLRGEDEVTIVYFGEGATSEGDFHEALNFAAIRKLPVIFFCENNGYAISEPQWKEMSIRNVADRARGYGLHGCLVDGNDASAVYQTTSSAVDECRRGHGPRLIEAKTYRLVPHTSSDDDRRYRTRAELEEWTRKDPIKRLHAYLEEQGLLDEEDANRLQAKAEAEVEDAVAYAEKQPGPAVEEAQTHVFYTPVGSGHGS
jgi:2-oxoisovalerate dehydrogenase E1 component alpha subunit